MGVMSRYFSASFFFFFFQESNLYVYLYSLMSTKIKLEEMNSPSANFPELSKVLSCLALADKFLRIYRPESNYTCCPDFMRAKKQACG